MQSVLFVGNYLYKHKAAKNIGEKVNDLLQSEYDIQLTSTVYNKVFRFIDIFFSTLFFKDKLIIIDVYSGPAFYMALLAKFVAKKIRNKKVVVIIRGGKFKEHYLDKKSVAKTFLDEVDAIVTPSIFIKEFLETEGYNVDYLPNFIMLDKFNDKQIERKPYSLLWVRNFRYIYNPDLAIKAFSRVLKNYPQATLTMVGGDGGKLEECKKLIDELKIKEKVNITGPIDNSKLPEYYNRHEVYLNTTTYESFGMAVLEAISCGMPVVSTKVGELPRIWEEDKEILFVDEFNEEKFAAKIAMLFADKDNARNIAKNAREKAGGFGWANLKPQWEEMFSKYSR